MKDVFGCSVCNVECSRFKKNFFVQGLGLFLRPVPAAHENLVSVYYVNWVSAMSYDALPRFLSRGRRG